MTTTNHTPTPWKLLPDTYSDGTTLKIVADGTSSLYVLVDGQDKKTNAEYIVQAVNAYDDLLAACEMMLRLVEGEELTEHFDGETEVLRDAIQRATTIN